MPFRRRAPETEPWVQVYRGTGPVDAYLLRDWLVRNEVTAQVRGENLMSLRGDIPIWDAWPTVWCPSEQQERARELIDTFFGPSLVHPSWRCARCDEENAPAFASCWSCGADRPRPTEPEPSG